MRTLCIAVIIGLLFFSAVSSKEIDTPKMGKHSFGWSAGYASISGLTYRYLSKNGNGFQTTVFPLFETSDASDFEHLNFYMNLDVMGLKNLHNNTWTNLFFYYGAGVEVDRYWGRSLLSIFSNSGNGYTQKINTSINSGVQIGINLYPVICNFGGGVSAIYLASNRKDDGFEFTPNFSVSFLIATARF